MERTVSVVNSGSDKIGQHVVGVGSANKLVYRNSHFLGVISGKNVSEVSGGNNDINLLACIYLAVLDKLSIG